MTLAMMGPQLAGIFVALLIGIVVAVFYLLTLQNTLKQVEEFNRQVPPANVWLMFIPFFNYVYGFILYPKICDSIKAEYAHRGLPQDGDFGRSLGLTMPILNLVGFVPVVGTLAGLANFVILIIFWVKMNGYKTKLETTPKGDVHSVGIGASPDLLDN